MEKGNRMKDFEILNRLGEGAFGQVFKIKRKEDGQIYALKKIKTISMNDKDKQNALNEVRILASYEGEHIIGFKEAFYDDASGSLCIVLEYAEQGDLLGKISLANKANIKIEEEEIWRALVHMTKGLYSMHSNKILHRDLKSANVFITADGIYKLGDLNISKILKRDLAQTQTGTPYYCSPEVWKNKPYGIKSDIWSLGCVLYEMAAQKPPFTANDLGGLFRKVCIGAFSRIPNFYSNELSDIISSMLKQNPNLRPTVEELLNNSVVEKNYSGVISLNKKNDFKLLNTIKADSRNWKSINLPKPKYEGSAQNIEEKDEYFEHFQRPRALSMEKAVSARDRVKSIEEISEEKRKARDFLNKSRSSKEKEKYEELKQVKEEIVRLEIKRERVLSACGSRPNKYAEESPKKYIFRPVEPASVKYSRKGSIEKLKLPPRPNAPQNNRQNYVVPPKPGSIKRENSKENILNIVRKESEVEKNNIDVKTVKKIKV